MQASAHSQIYPQHILQDGESAFSVIIRQDILLCNCAIPL